MRANEYLVFEHAVQQNLSFVWRRAFKHDEDPPYLTDPQHEALQEAICNEVMNGIAEWFTFDEDEDYDGDFYLLTDTAGRVWFHSEHGLYMDLEVTKLRRSFLSSICRMVQQWYLARYKSHRLEHVTGTNLERGLSDSAAGRDSLCAGHHGGERVHDAHPSGKDPRTTPLTASDREGQA